MAEIRVSDLLVASDFSCTMKIGISNALGRFAGTEEVSDQTLMPIRIQRSNST